MTTVFDEFHEMEEVLVHEGPWAEIIKSSIPIPNAGEVVIKVDVSGTNPKDWKTCWAPALPVSMGDDIAGTVHGVGQDVTGFEVCACPRSEGGPSYHCPLITRMSARLEIVSSHSIRSTHLTEATPSMRLLVHI